MQLRPRSGIAVGTHPAVAARPLGRRRQRDGLAVGVAQRPRDGGHRFDAYLYRGRMLALGFVNCAIGIIGRRTGRGDAQGGTAHPVGPAGDGARRAAARRQGHRLGTTQITGRRGNRRRRDAHQADRHGDRTALAGGGALATGRITRRLGYRHHDTGPRRGAARPLPGGRVGTAGGCQRHRTGSGDGTGRSRHRGGWSQAGAYRHGRYPGRGCTAVLGAGGRITRGLGQGWCGEAAARGPRRQPAHRAAAATRHQRGAAAAADGGAVDGRRGNRLDHKGNTFRLGAASRRGHAVNVGALLRCRHGADCPAIVGDAHRAVGPVPPLHIARRNGVGVQTEAHPTTLADRVGGQGAGPLPVGVHVGRHRSQPKGCGPLQRVIAQIFDDHRVAAHPPGLGYRPVEAIGGKTTPRYVGVAHVGSRFVGGHGGDQLVIDVDLQVGRLCVTAVVDQPAPDPGAARLIQPRLVLSAHREGNTFRLGAASRRGHAVNVGALLRCRDGVNIPAVIGDAHRAVGPVPPLHIARRNGVGVQTEAHPTTLADRVGGQSTGPLPVGVHVGRHRSQPKGCGSQQGGPVDILDDHCVRTHPVGRRHRPAKAVGVVIVGRHHGSATQGIAHVGAMAVGDRIGGGIDQLAIDVDPVVDRSFLAVAIGQPAGKLGTGDGIQGSGVVGRGGINGHLVAGGAATGGGDRVGIGAHQGLVDPVLIFPIVARRAGPPHSIAVRDGPVG
ncbi:hypothetical protein IC229_33880 [Spirosoma sp. BT702]|uniref:Uncharacterized protein n=1 Tax=Spirosoma profusum TaxID=2771354 RepID=A0A927AWE0_9BACT|nr:hypothetical protein [Spirosoma profusum]MBD2705647.1 hypothetical protein [Spirosoma profusum]